MRPFAVDRLTHFRTQVSIARLSRPTYDRQTKRRIVFMFERSVALVLISAIVVCPLWCGIGPCCAGRCSAKELIDTAQRPSFECCTLHRVAGCCCETATPYSDKRLPVRCPDKSCQGVCGGAVFGKSVDLNGVLSLFVQPLDMHTIAVMQPIAERRISNDAHRWKTHGRNRGYTLRVLHQSLLI